MGLSLTQWTKFYLIDAVIRRCSVRKVLPLFWQNSEKNACIGDLKKLWEALYLKRDSCIRLSCEFFKTLRNRFFIEHLWTATSVLGKTLKDFIVNYDVTKYLTTLTIINDFAENIWNSSVTMRRSQSPIKSMMQHSFGKFFP